MATEVHSIPATPTLLERRSSSRLQLLSDNTTPHLTDPHTQNKDEVSRIARRNLTSPFTFTPLTPILASPVPTPANATASPSNSSTNLNLASLPSTLAQNSGGVKHIRSRSTLSRLHVTLPEDYFDTQNHVKSGSPPSPLLKDVIILNGIPIVKTPSLPEDTAPRGVDFPAVSSQVSVTPKMSRPRKKSARTSFTLGSDVEDDASGQQQKREAGAKAKQLERYDDLRRYHALMELLKTEAKYLQDLWILTNVYLQQLPHAVTSRSVASYFGTSSSSSKQTPSPSASTFSSTHTQGQPSTAPPSPVHSSPAMPRRSIGPNDRVEFDKDLPFTRPIFTEEDIKLLCRNSSEILTFHERFVDDLKEALAPLGSKFRFDTKDEYAYVDMPRHDTLELSIQIIVSMFVDRAQSFKLYKSFCSTHSEAVELVQRAKRVSPADWEAWEKRCRNYVLDNHRCHSFSVPGTRTAVQFGLDGDSGPSPREPAITRSQTAQNNRPRSFISSKPPRANTAPAHPVSRHNHHGRDQTPRLEFMDHMIKPIQRICKYHLLLDQLKSRVPSHTHSQQWTEGGSDHSRHNPGAGVDITFDPAELFSAGQTESLVSHACEAMREVVTSVNDDRRKHEDRWKALLIASRTLPSPVASSSSPHPQLTSEFLMTLGNCLMGGALDVIYYRPTTSTITKAKYLGAFLYEQGYLALVKVGKGKTYEPQHWFSLKDFDVLNLNDEDGTFPYSFHLTGNGHHFQLAAACQKEKEVWMEGLRKAIAATTGSDPAELPSSLLNENKEEVVPTPPVTVHDPPTEGLPTIQSETEHLEDLLLSRPGILKTMSELKTLSDDGHSIRTDSRPDSQPVSRRGSSNSVRAIFSPFLFDSGVRLLRPTTVQRNHTDQGLLDVFSESCRDARNLAELQNQELFQTPRPITRTKSGAAVSGSRGRKDSKMFNRRSYCAPSPSTLSSYSANSTTTTTIEKKVKRRNERPSSVMVFTQSWFGEDSTPDSALTLQPPSFTVLSPEEEKAQTSPGDVTTSLCSSEMPSNVGSALSSPTGLKPSSLGSPCIGLNTTNGSFDNTRDLNTDYRPKRSKSMVDNVKSFFASPSKKLSRHPSTGAELLADGLSLTRGRTRSSPTPHLHGPLGHSLPSVTVHPVDVVADTPIPLPGQGRHPIGALGRKRSLFAYGRRHGTDVSRLSAMSTVSATSSITDTSGSNTPVRRRSVKDILLHFRNS